MKRCDRCGQEVWDAIGTRQACLFDVAPADPRATDAARAELRAGRVLCSACQRTPELFEPEGNEHPDDWQPMGPETSACVMAAFEANKARALAHADAAATVDAVGQTFDVGDSTIRTTLEAFQVAPDPRLAQDIIDMDRAAGAAGMPDPVVAAVAESLKVPVAPVPGLTPAEIYNRNPRLYLAIVESWKLEGATDAERIAWAVRRYAGEADAAPAPSKPRRKRNKNWRGDANADAWERAKAGR